MVRKRLLTYVTALACAAAITACGGQGGAAEETNSVQTEAASETAAGGESEAAESESEAAENESEAAEGEAETAESEAMPVAEYNQKYLTVYFDDTGRLSRYEFTPMPDETQADQMILGDKEAFKEASKALEEAGATEFLHRDTF